MILPDPGRRADLAIANRDKESTMAIARFWGPVLPLAGAAAALCALAGGSAYAERPPGAGHVEIPESSIEQPGDNGKNAHTNIKLFVLEGAQQLNSPKAAPQAGGPPYS